MISVSKPNNNNKLVSTFGKDLLSQLSNPSIASVDKILEFIHTDPLAGRLRNEFGDNSFHLLLGSYYNKSFVLPILDLLLAKCPEGLKVANKTGNYPIHLCFTQYPLNTEAILKILKVHPQSAELKNGLDMIPLFLCVMRDDASAEICKALCKCFPAGPATVNRTNSYPLHFATKRENPNKEILQILLRRYPEAASVTNNYGWIPLHLACSYTDDLDAVRMIHNAYPEGVKVQDRQGRTCLHLAVLAVGKDHSFAVAKENEEIEMEKARLKLKALQAKREGGERNAPESEDEYDSEEESCKSSQFAERPGKSRRVVRYIASCWPEAMVMNNNFQATPVETVLEKTNPVKTKHRIVSVYGLYDDPPTARLLLLLQKRYSLSKTSAGLTIPGLKLRYEKPLRELNWAARREAIFISLVGEPRPGSPAQQALNLLRRLHICPSDEKLMTEIFSLVESLQLADKQSEGKVAASNKKGNKKLPAKVATSNTVFGVEYLYAVTAKYTKQDDPEIPRSNILARFRRLGYLELIRAVVVFL